MTFKSDASFASFFKSFIHLFLFLLRLESVGWNYSLTKQRPSYIVTYTHPIVKCLDAGVLATASRIYRLLFSSVFQNSKRRFPFLTKTAMDLSVPVNWVQ